MFQEVVIEIRELSQDLKFVRNLSLTFIAVIVMLFSLSDLQNQTKTIDTQQMSFSSDR